MLMKLFFILLVLLFGLLMFVTGVLAPPGVNRETARIAHQVMAMLPLGAGPSTPAGDVVKSPGEEKAPEETPVPTETLLLPTPLPAQGLYALQLGQFGNGDGADVLLARVRTAGIEVRKIAAVDRNGQAWWIVAAGSYPQPDEARTARSMMAREVGILEEMPIILLPGAAAAPGPGAAAPPTAAPRAPPTAPAKS